VTCDACKKDIYTDQPTVTLHKACAQAAVEWRQLFEDHSAAMEMLRAVARNTCPHYCLDDCVACRAKAFLFTSSGKAR
jgi:hypothetical protein